MRKLRSLWFLLLAFPAAASCSGPSAEHAAGPSITVDAAGVEIIEYPELSQDATWFLSDQPLVSIGVDTGEAPYMFTRIGDVQLLPDGSLLVAERSALEVRVFDAGGNFVRSFGREGQGPGEFEDLYRMAVRGGAILTWDSANRLSTFTIAGDLRSTTRTNNIGGNPNTLVEGVFGDGTLLVTLSTLDFPSGPNLMQIRSELVRWSPGDEPDDVVSFTIVDSAQNWVEPELNMTLLVPFSPRAKRAAGDDALYVSPAGSFELHRYRLDGSLERIVRVRGVAESITSDFAAEFTRGRIEGSDESRRETLRAIYAKMPFPEHFPLVDDLHVDDENHVWLRRFRPPPAEVDQVFHVFGPDGNLAGTIHLPANLEFRLATQDRIIGVWRDDLDVQSLRIYGLERG